MSQILTENINVDTAKAFVDNLVLTNDTGHANLYLVISRVGAWANDAAPPAPTDDVFDMVNLWRGMIGGKKITGNDVQLVVPNNTWTANTVYAAYSDQNTIFGTNFYVLTSDYNVYKCLSNASGSLSTVQPTYTSVDKTIQESDGYIWKYMLSLRTSDRQRFLTPDWFPVRKLSLDDGSLQWLVQENAVDGGIHVVNMTNGGVGYSNVNNLVITITGDGSHAIATGNINVTSQTVNGITITTPGSGFHYANVVISGGGGSNATANVVISPFLGHGSDAPHELGASSVMINIRLEEDENGKLTVQNDYRQIAILEEPLVFGTPNNISNSVFSQVFTIQVGSGFGDFISDEYVFQGGTLPTATFSGRVVNWDTSNNVLSLAETAGTISSALLTGINSGISRFVVNSTNPDVIPYSGIITYMENVTPITRASDQTEALTTVITF